jgi:hypothetical protein
MYQEPGVVLHAFNPSTWEAEAGGVLSSRPAWSTEWVPGQPELYRETLSRKTKKKKKKKKCIKNLASARLKDGYRQCCARPDGESPLPSPLSSLPSLLFNNSVLHSATHYRFLRPCDHTTNLFLYRALLKCPLKNSSLSILYVWVTWLTFQEPRKRHQISQD